jgi:hypothetical protein
MNQIRAAILAYIAGRTTLADLEAVLVDLVWDRRTAVDPATVEFASQTELRIAEFTSGLFTEYELKLEFLGLLHTLAVQTVLTRRREDQASRQFSRMNSVNIGHTIAGRRQLSLDESGVVSTITRVSGMRVATSPPTRTVNQYVPVSRTVTRKLMMTLTPESGVVKGAA